MKLGPDGQLVQSEAQWQQQVLEYAALRGWTWRHDVATNAPRTCRRCRLPIRTPRNRAGDLDLRLMRAGGPVLWVELKSESGRVTREQHAEIELLRACGQVVYVWRPSDWNDVERILR